jgi:hypothetical protein
MEYVPGVLYTTVAVSVTYNDCVLGLPPGASQTLYEMLLEES